MPIDTYPDEVNTALTRSEILAAVRPAFAGTGASKTDLLASADAAGARPEAIAILRALPENTELRHARELWAHLPDLPVT
ncbi:MAG: DUF2795 domain-containing protein [Solirubrobacteraceae bacterium]